ncbi:MAG: insulinase family protein [bacterium]|nr:insulinase family protein [bacterium]
MRGTEGRQVWKARQRPAHRRSRLCAVGVACAVVALVTIGRAATGTSIEVTPVPDEAVVTTFPNGMKLVVLPRPAHAMVSIDVYIEPIRIEARPGLIHLCEHLLFASSVGAPRGSLLDSLLLNGGTFQATTSLQGIHIQDTCLPSRLGAALALEAERLVRLRPEPADLDRERRRVLGEFNLYHVELPAAAIGLRVMALAYGDGAAAGDPLLGDPDEIRAITLEDVERFLAVGLRPERTCVLVAGPVDPAQVVELAAASLGQIVAADPAPEPIALPPLPAPREPWTVDAEIQSDHLAVGFRLPCRSDQELALSHLAAAIMARESGDPQLSFHGDEALLTLHIRGEWTRGGGAADGAQRAVTQFWDQTRRLLFNVADEWTFERNRRAGMHKFRERVADPLARSRWLAQRLATGRLTPEPEALAALMDSLPHGTVATYFAEHFTRERAHVAMAVARPPRDPWLATIRLHRRLEINPYLGDQREGSGLAAERIESLLAAAARLALPTLSTVPLPDGRTVGVVPMRGDRVQVGAVRNFAPDFAGKKRQQSAERLVLLEVLANLGYGTRGSAKAPRGYQPGSATTIALTPGSLAITAEGLGTELPLVVADLCKRLEVTSLNAEALRLLQDASQRWTGENAGEAHNRAAIACLERVHGPGSPLAAWCRPTTAVLRDWTVGDAERMLAGLVGDQDLEFFVVGDLADQDVAAVLAKPIARLARTSDLPAKPGPMPAARGGGTGLVVHYPVPDVAAALFLGGGCTPDVTDGLTTTDLRVLSRVISSRLESAARAAGIDSLAVVVAPMLVGPLTLPWVRVGAPTHAIESVVSLVRGQLDGLASRPIDRHEEARARMEMLGPQIEELAGIEGMLAHLLESAPRGGVPSQPLADLCTLRTDLLAERAPRLFATADGAFAVIGDTTTLAVGALRRELGGE